MDKSYWSKFYAKHIADKKPSLFAKFVWENYLREMPHFCHIERSEVSQKNSLRLIELGCGNGRDSVYFAKNGVTVLGIDQCENMIDSLNKKHKSANLAFKSGDFTALPNAESAFDTIYSRFTLHSINASQQSNLFKWISANLKADGILAIECRGYKNALYGLGEMVETDAFIYENHYRRFVNLESLLEILGDDYQIAFAKEDKGFAPFKDEDDFFVRIIAIYRGGGELSLNIFLLFTITLDSRYSQNLHDKRTPYVA